MREYVFRGYDAVGDKGWVYGDLVHNKKVTKTGLEDRVMVGGYEVVPESVGLFTGVKDKNGKDIYEGDIISYSRYICEEDPEGYFEDPVTFTEGVFCMDEDWGYSLREAIFDASECDGVKIIGNVFEQKKSKD